MGTDSAARAPSATISPMSGIASVSRRMSMIFRTRREVGGALGERSELPRRRRAKSSVGRRVEAPLGDRLDRAVRAERRCAARRVSQRARRSRQSPSTPARRLGGEAAP
jgi:hypothetical protein